MIKRAAMKMKKAVYGAECREKPAGIATRETTSPNREIRV
jgi:hypothetical protein